MLFGFDTEDSTAAAGALLIYATYKSRDPKRGPSGYEMWAQIERFAKQAAKRAENISGFLDKFKSAMACGTINPKWCKTGIVGANARVLADGSIITKGDGSEDRDFMISLIEAPVEEQEKIVECIYGQTQRLILLVRDRLEREKPYLDTMEDE